MSWLAEVLAAHIQVEGFDEIGGYWKYGCDCSWTGSGDADHRAHLAAAIRDHIAERLADAGAVEVVGDALGKTEWDDGLTYHECNLLDAAAALAAVREVIL